ncbi:MAG: septum formation initiator family protein [Anaerolineae bacterium]
MSAVDKKKRSFDLPLTKFAAIIVLTIVVLLIIDFGRRAAASYRIRQEEERVLVQLAEAEAHRATLEARRGYVTSDEYVAEVARQQLKWSLPGETVVVILATPQAPAGAAPAQVASSFSGPPKTPVEAWWRVLFGASPSP